MSDDTIWAPLPKLVDGGVVEPWQTLGGRRVSLDDPESVEIFREIYGQIHQEARGARERDGRLLDHYIDHIWLEPFDTVLRRTQPHLTPKRIHRFSQPDGYFIEHFRPGQERGVPARELYVDPAAGTLRPDKTHGQKYYGYSAAELSPTPEPMFPNAALSWYDFWEHEYGEENVCFTKARDLLKRMTESGELEDLDDYLKDEFLAFADWFDYWVSAGHHIRHEIPEWEDDDPPVAR